MKRTVTALVALSSATLAACDGTGNKYGEAIVSVTVYNHGTPIKDADVVFHNDGGSALGHYKTNDSGVATYLDFVDGGMISVLQRTGVEESDYEVTTFTDVKAGDQLFVGQRWLDEQDLIEGEAKVQMPVGLYPNAMYYKVTAGCGAVEVPDPNRTEVLLPIAKECVTPEGTFSVIAMVFDVDNRPIAYASSKDEPLRPAGVEEVDLYTWSSDFTNIKLRLTSAPVESVLTGGRVWAEFDDADFIGAAKEFTSLTPGGSVEYDFDMAPGIGTSTRYEAFVVQTENGKPENSSVATLEGRTQSNPEELTIDLTADMLPRLYSVKLTASSASVASGQYRPEMRWTRDNEDSIPMLADAAIVELNWATPAAGHKWTLMTRGDVKTPILFPELPSEFKGYRATKDVTGATPMIRFIDADFVSDYDQMKNDYGMDLIKANKRYYKDIIPAGNFEIKSVLGGTTTVE